MSKNKIAGKMILVLLSICLLVTACSAPGQPDEIVIGVVWPFERLDRLFEKGIDLAVEEINQTGGIQGKSVRLLKKDDRSELEKGLLAAQSFADDPVVQAVIGHANSFISIPASTIYHNAGLVMISPASTAPALTQSGFDNVFRMIPSDNEIARQMARYLAAEGYKRIVIYFSNDSYGTGLANSFERNANLLGMTVVDRINFYTGIENLIRLHQRWQAFGYDAVFIARSLPDGGYFIRDARMAGVEASIFAGNALDSPQLWEIAGNASEGVIVGSVFNPYSEDEKTKMFTKTFFEKYQQIPSTYAALGYDVVKLIAAAMENNVPLERQTLAQEIKKIPEWHGVAGMHLFDNHGENIGDIVVLKQLQEGTFIYIEK